MQATQPLFSIVIPTKNRPDLLRDAISSVILQDFDDYELVISDNFNDERTKKVIEEFSANPHLKYFRTDQELNMPDHWEFATRHASGKYVLLLSDRSLLAQGALRKICNLINEEREEVPLYSWQHLAFDNDTKFLMAYARPSLEIKRFSAKELLKEYALDQKLDHRFPVGLNSCYRYDVAEKVRKKYGRLFYPPAPDNSSCFMLLFNADKVTFISQPLYIYQGSKDSNGVLWSLYGPEVVYLPTLRPEDLYRYVPIKAPFIHSLVFDSYLAASALNNNRLDFPEVDWATYFLRCYEEWTYYSKTSFMKKLKDEFFKIWENELRRCEPAIQNKVRKRMFLAKMRFNPKALLVKSPFLPILRKIQNRAIYNYPNKYYDTALEAAGFSKETLKPYAKVQ